MKHWKTWGAYSAICLIGIFCLAGGIKLINGKDQAWDIRQNMPEVLTVKKGSFQIMDKAEEAIEDNTIQNIKAFGNQPAAGPGQDINLLGGAKLTLLANKSASQMLSCILETSKGSLIVIDGGTADDAGHLAETIKAKGGRVSAWLITHPHSDHVGAMSTILNQPDNQIVVDNVYYSFADLEWYQKNEAYRADMVAQITQSLATLPRERLHGDIDKGYQFMVDDVKITVLNKPYLFETNSINNSSVAYRLEVNNKRIVFLGDMGPEAGDQLIKDQSSEELKCDILQMSHHGQYGVNENVYKILSPTICLWPTPQWLWDNDNGGGPGSGPWFTLDTRAWMENIGVEKNYCIKDGDQVIK